MSETPMHFLEFGTFTKQESDPPLLGDRFKGCRHDSKELLLRDVVRLAPSHPIGTSKFALVYEPKL